MTIFSEIYGVYYNAIAKILKEIIEGNTDLNRFREIMEQSGFVESAWTIESKLQNQDWQLIRKDGTTSIQHVPSMPCTLLQKRWLKAMSLDPRIKLFNLDFSELDDVEPLFTEQDFCIVDKYNFGDPYDDELYIANFRTILKAIKEKKALKINLNNKDGSKNSFWIEPKHLEYSAKDDRFRLLGSGYKYGVFNLCRIANCCIVDRPNLVNSHIRKDAIETVTLLLTNKRNALERAMMHFAHLEKRVEKIDEDHYQIKIQYYQSDETEMVIRILAFGPMIRVVQPQAFIDLIKERLMKQKICELK